MTRWPLPAEVNGEQVTHHSAEGITSCAKGKVLRGKRLDYVKPGHK